MSDTIIGDNDAAIVFSKDRIELSMPDGDDDSSVPEHILVAVCVYVLINEHQDKIRPLLKDIREQIANE
jgi:hypothetical protein